MSDLELSDSDSGSQGGNLNSFYTAPGAGELHFGARKLLIGELLRLVYQTEEGERKSRRISFELNLFV